MNRITEKSFENLKKSIDIYKSAVRKALAIYAADRERAAEYKADVEQEKIDKAKGKARSSIETARRTLNESAAAELATLSEEVVSHCMAQPSEAFRRSIELFSDFRVCPAAFEIRALIRESAGSPLAFRAINSLLEKTGSEWRVDFDGPEIFEADLRQLEHFTSEGILWEPTEEHSAVCEIMKGVARPVATSDGAATVYSGATWDSISLLAASGSFQSLEKSLDEISARWQSVTPSLKSVKMYEPTSDADGNDVPVASQFAADVHAAADAAEITAAETNPEAIRAARSAAASNKKAAEVFAKYAKAQ